MQSDRKSISLSLVQSIAKETVLNGIEFRTKNDRNVASMVYVCKK